MFRACAYLTIIPLFFACAGEAAPGDASVASPDAGSDVGGDTGADALVDGGVDAGMPVAPVVGDLLIEELYYSGAPPAGGADHYFSDQFIELVSTSDRPLDLSGVYVGEVVGVAGAINPGFPPNSYRTTHPDQVVMSTVWRVPSGVILAPGGHFVIAHDGTNHRPFSGIDLSGADVEAWVEGSGDEDSPTVANLESVVFGGGRDWLLTVFGPSVVILAADAPLTDLDENRAAPASSVLDAIETLMDADSADYKRLPDAIDTGHAFVSGTYSGESLQRVRTADGFQDTGDSRADFVLAAPDPGPPTAPGVVTGEPWVELGTGVTAFESLEEEARLELVAGFQGGWHVDVAIRFGGFEANGLLLVYEALTVDAVALSFPTEATLSERRVIADGDDFARVGDRVVLDIGDASDVVGQEVVVRVTAALGDRTVSDERVVTIVDER